MVVRLCREGDFYSVMKIYENARSFMRKNGNPDQWGNSYPSDDLIRNDINNKKMYAIVDNDEICGVFYFSIGTDKTYIEIEDGKWLNNDEYGVIHRIASDGKTKGILSCAVSYCSRFVSNIRIDTHKDNIVMQNALVKNGFIRCGIIRIEDGSPRIAYQKVI